MRHDNTHNLSLSDTYIFGLCMGSILIALPKVSNFLQNGYFFDCYTWAIVLINLLIVQALISVQALVFDLAQPIRKKWFDCRNAILGSSAILLGTSYSQIVVAVLL